MLKSIIIVNWVVLITLVLIIVLGHGGMEPDVAIIPQLNSVALFLRFTLLIWMVFLSVITMICGTVYIVKTSKQKTLSYFTAPIWVGATIGPFIILIWAISTGQNY
jgi:hypothetical protein